MNTDDADIFRFTRFSGNKPMWMDNSMLISTVWGRYGGNYPYYPGKARLYNIFEPFLNTGISNHLDKIDRSMFYLNFSPLGEIDIIRTATAADYMWNTRDYNPELSLWRVLFSRYGRESAQMLVNYADQYSLILEFLLKVERNEQASRNLKNAQTIFGELVALSNNIEKKLGPRHPLMADLYLLNKQLKKKADGFMVSISKSQKDL
jgi:hypothetical protein